MQVIDQIRKELKGKGVSVLKLSNETGISAYKIYKWLDNKGKPKHDDVLLLEKWLRSGLDNVPRETNGNTIVSEPATPYVKNPASNETGLKDELIVSYKEQIRLLKQELANYNDLRQFITALQLPVLLHDLTDKVKAIAGIVEENRVFLKRLASLVSDPDESLNDRGVIKTYGSTRRKAADKSGKKT